MKMVMMGNDSIVVTETSSIYRTFLEKQESKKVLEGLVKKNFVINQRISSKIIYLSLESDPNTFYISWNPTMKEKDTEKSHLFVTSSHF